MKIVVSGYVGKKITGIGRNLLSLLSFTGDDNEYVVYVNEDIAHEFCVNKKNVTIRTYGVSKDSSIGNLLWTTFIFPFKVRSEKADVALIPNFTLLLFKFKPTVVIINDLIEFNVPDKFSKLKMFYRTKIADPLMAKKSTRIMTISACSAADIQKLLGVTSSKIDIVSCGVDGRKFKHIDEMTARKCLARLSLPERFILYAGTIDHPGKNAYTLLEAFEGRCADGYEGSLVLVGMPGSGYEVVERRIKESSFRDRIVLAGYVSDDELIALYSICDVFCFLSLYEGFGMPPLEALSCGAKVITSNTSSLPEAVGNCGITVSPQDVAAVSDAIKRAIEGPNLDEEAVGKHLSFFEYPTLSKKMENCLGMAVISK